MNAFTKVSGKGQVVVPKALRDLKGWATGTDLEVIDAGDGVLLRPRRAEPRTLILEEAAARMRQLYTHRGPPIPIEKLGWSSDVDDDH